MIQFSVIMPTYNQAAYIRNAIRSLFAQTYQEWELIIVNDGCTDNTEEYICDYLKDDRVTYLKNTENEGIGAAINKAMQRSRYEYIAYLPSDDFFYINHLESMAKVFLNNPNVVLVTTGMKSELCDSLLEHKIELINGFPQGLSQQLVQSAHRKTVDRWVERNEWESEDLYISFFRKLTDKGEFYHLDKETCQWLVHPMQRYKILGESYGGNVNRFRAYYHVKTPLKVKISAHRFLDEEEKFKEYRKEYPQSPVGLKILIVGELSYNQERIIALQEAGHQLYGLWTVNPTFSFSNVGPLPFGKIHDIDAENWQEEVDCIKPDIIYAMTNFSAIPIAHEVLKKKKSIPFVWHFKEGPFLCFEHEYWSMLVDLYNKADGVIFLNEEMKRWQTRYIPLPNNYCIMDADLPKKDYFKEELSHKLSDLDGEIHTVIPGRIIGVKPEDIKTLSEYRIHIHLYAESYEESIAEFIKEAQDLGGRFFHVHKHCGPKNWTKEFSQYDAGWLHIFKSNNYGDLDKATWNDLNLPARITTMMSACIPCIQLDNSEHVVAMQSCIKEIDCGIFYTDFKDLALQLYNKKRMMVLTKNVIKHRMEFAFDSHVPELIYFFRQTIKNKQNHD